MPSPAPCFGDTLAAILRVSLGVFRKEDQRAKGPCLFFLFLVLGGGGVGAYRNKKGAVSKGGASQNVWVSFGPPCNNPNMGTLQKHTQRPLNRGVRITPQGRPLPTNCSRHLKPGWG